METRKKSTTGEVVVQLDKGNNINFQIPSMYAQRYFNLKQKYISYGAKAIGKNRSEAEVARISLQEDLESGEFEPTNLIKYKHKSKAIRLKQQQPKKELTLLELFDKYCEYKKPSLDAHTFINYTGYFRRAIKELPQDYTKQLEMRNYLIENRAATTVVKVLSTLDSCLKWAQKEELIPDSLVIKLGEYAKDFKSNAQGVILN